MPTVLVIGDVMTDIVVRPDGPIAVGADRRAHDPHAARWGGREPGLLAGARRDRTCASSRGSGTSDHARQKLLLAGYGVDARLGADR